MITTLHEAYDQRDMNAVRIGALGRFLLVALPSLAAATIIVWWLQDGLGVPNPSAVYLVAVVATAIAAGTLGAVATAAASFVLRSAFGPVPMSGRPGPSVTASHNH